MALFLHISDIHFRRWSGSQYDPDDDLRNELLRDAKQFSAENGSPDGILISGDIAFSGSRNEYDIAKDWLRQLCENVDCTLAAVWCVPGNHDVDQRVAKESRTLEQIQERLRDTASQRPHELEGEILQLMEDPFARDPVFRPLKHYNDFAATFNCSISPDNSYWRQSFSLVDGWVLRLSGLTSTLVSNHFDNKHQFVIIGEYQAPNRSDGVIDVVMCHHPHDWLRAADGFKNMTNRRACLQLYGHKHMQAIQMHDGSLHVVAGAVHPDRREPAWRPRYNWLRVTIDSATSSPERTLKVAVYPRIWNDDETAFTPDFNSCGGNDHRDDSFQLPAWSPPVNTRAGNLPSVAPVSGAAMNPHRVLTYRFFDLSHVQRVDIAQRLRLLRDDDEGVRDSQLYQRVFERASQENMLDKLWEAVENEHNDGKHPSNPFAVTQDA